MALAQLAGHQHDRRTEHGEHHVQRADRLEHHLTRARLTRLQHFDLRLPLVLNLLEQHLIDRRVREQRRHEVIGGDEGVADGDVEALTS